MKWNFEFDKVQHRGLYVRTPTGCLLHEACWRIRTRVDDDRWRKLGLILLRSNRRFGNTVDPVPTLFGCGGRFAGIFLCRGCSTATDRNIY